MNRKALLLYLRELRDLEFASWKIEQMYNDELQRFEEKYHELTDMFFVDEPIKISGWNGLRKFGFISCLIMSVLIGVMLAVAKITGEDFASDSSFVGFFLFFALMLAGFATAIYVCVAFDRSENEEAIKKAEEFNESEYVKRIANQNEAEKLKSDWEVRFTFLQKEYEKVNALLKANYDLNIIPSQYRNIASIYYIYDYMSTSNASLEETLIHEHMENGIQRILEKLDYIIEQNYELIMQNRRIEATNQQILQTNQQMLKQLEAVEEQTYIATQYAELSANYNEATAYFSLANYLK